MAQQRGIAGLQDLHERIRRSASMPALMPSVASGTSQPGGDDIASLIREALHGSLPEAANEAPSESETPGDDADSLSDTSPDEFAQRWRTSKQRRTLVAELEAYEEKHPSEERLTQFEQSRRAEQSTAQRSGSPYIISYPQQVRLTLWRGWRRLRADPGFAGWALAGAGPAQHHQRL